MPSQDFARSQRAILSRHHVRRSYDANEETFGDAESRAGIPLLKKDFREDL